PLVLEKGDHVCLVGNALGERMQHHSFWETLLYQRFPEQELVVRNLCFPGDEPFQRIRSLNFGSPDEHLTHSGASVVLFFFGYNESFAGEAGLPAFRADLKKLIEETKTKDYSGKGPPRMALISPIAFENTGDPNLPDGVEHNRRLAAYAAAMSDVAEETGVAFVDLFTPTKELFEKSEERLTLNGAHFNEEGYRALAPILDRELFGGSDSTDARPAGSRLNEELRSEITDKSFHWWHRYRAVNGYSIYGKRGAAGSDGTYNNTDVMERERAILDQMCAIRDARIWRVAQSKDVPPEVDDSNTLPFITPKSNVGGDDDPNRRAGKLGSLEYRTAAEQEKLFKLPPGYKINLVASEEQFPALANPVAINFDGQGRLWVTTMPSYPHWKPKTKLDDKLLILEDRDRDGRADECKVFAGGLHQPTGFELGRGGVFVAQQPDVLFLQDTDGDDRADVRIRRIVGLDSADSHHGPAAFEWGPDGALYFQEGTFKQSAVETIDGPVRLADAGVWRYDPRTEKFEVHASLAFANPWGHVFDRWGQNFIADASPGNNYWAAPISGFVPYPDKHPGGARDGALDWGGSKSDKSISTFIVKRIRPSSGCEIVSSRNFPPEAQGNFLLNNVIGDLAVLQHRMHEKDSGFFGVEIEPLVTGQDGNFRPVDLQFAPDGSLYIVDWHNALIGHLQHNLREPHRDHSHGRIWRVMYDGRPLLHPPQIAGAPVASLLELLKEPEDRTRYRARRELAQRGTAEVIAALQKWIDDLDPEHRSYQHHLLEGLWIYQTHNVVNEELLAKLLESPDHRARAAAVRVLSFWRDRVQDPLALVRAKANDSHPRVRLEAVRACSFIHSKESLEIALEVLNYEMDEYLAYTLDETVRVLEELVVGPAPERAHAHHGHNHAGHDHGESKQPPPLVFLDKSPRIVEFQLARLSPAQLLLVERSPEDAKSSPVYEAILLRPGVSRQDREEAAEALSRLHGASQIDELLAALGRLDGEVDSERTVIRQLAEILLRQPAAELSKHAVRFRDATASENPAVRSAGHAGLIAIGNAASSWEIGRKSAAGKRDFLAAAPLIPSRAIRASLRDRVLECLADSQSIAVRRAAIEALASIPTQQSETFQLIAPLVASPKLREAAVDTLLQIPKDQRPGDAAAQVVEILVKHAEATPAAKRTTPDFLEAMHLADELLALLPVADARRYRDRLREVVVRVVQINTIQEEMRYDTPYFAVEAGRPVQLVLRNPDLMSHNLVICAPGKLREVAQEAAGMSPAVDADGRQFTPDSENVLFATRMVPAHSQDVLTFTAPQTPGEYPYVCTFPNHWMRMYGVMVVVDDLDAWRADPTPPADPLGITREFVQSWTMEDFSGDLAAAISSRPPDLGERLFKEATCLQCHKIRDQGGAVGPDLSEVFQRNKGDHAAVLREILDPSHKVEPKYALYNVLTADGKVLSGIVTDQNAETITLITNPEDPKPQVIAREDIDEMAKSSTSMMPKGLMDRFTKEEILEILNYLHTAQKP
ncbi:MAG: HEAT repeat domain-containing protein, partial [Planctomycetes bacterium]|nr:HEAT repeat domain-containing protein [Planctomycetota bacterium]